MSYRYYLLDSNVCIPRESLDAAKGAAIARAMGDGFEVDGDTDLACVFGWYGFSEPIETKGGFELPFCFPDEAEADPERLLQALAPYAADGTRVIWLGEDFDVWRGGFEGGEYVTSDADLTRVP